MSCDNCGGEPDYALGLCMRCYQDRYRARRWAQRRARLIKQVEQAIAPYVALSNAPVVAAAAADVLAPKPRPEMRKAQYLHRRKGRAA